MKVMGSLVMIIGGVTILFDMPVNSFSTGLLTIALGYSLMSQRRR